MEALTPQAKRSTKTSSSRSKVTEREAQLRIISERWHGNFGNYLSALAKVKADARVKADQGPKLKSTSAFSKLLRNR